MLWLLLLFCKYCGDERCSIKLKACYIEAIYKHSNPRYKYLLPLLVEQDDSGEKMTGIENTTPHIQDAYRLLRVCAREQLAEKAWDIVLDDIHDMFVFRASESSRTPIYYNRHCATLKGVGEYRN